MAVFDQKPTATKTKPVGSINLTLEGVRLFTCSVWKESTTDSQIKAELNELALCKKMSKEQTEQLIKEKLLNLLEVEINVAVSSGESLLDLLNLS